MIIVPREKQAALIDWLKAQKDLKRDADLAAALGEGRAVVSRIRNGATICGVTFIAGVLELLDMRPSELKQHIAELP